MKNVLSGVGQINTGLWPVFCLLTGHIHFTKISIFNPKNNRLIMKHPHQFKKSKQVQSNSNSSSKVLANPLKTTALPVRQEEAIRQNQLASLANRSTRLQHLSTIQAMADRSLLQAKAVDPQAPNGKIIQRAVTTNGGEFETEKYEPYPDRDFRTGADIELLFTPNRRQDDKKIGLVQSVRSEYYKDDGNKKTNKEQYGDFDPFKVERMTEEGVHIDQSSFMDTKGRIVDENEAQEEDFFANATVFPQTNPVYNSTNAPGKIAKTLEENVDETEIQGRIHNGLNDDPAILKDSPGRFLSNSERVIQEFETTALDLTNQVYLGSVRWGYEAEADDEGEKTSKVMPTNITLISNGDPSASFREAAELWNDQKVPASRDSEEVDRVQLPLP